jgi:hypothetical protein
MPCLPPQTKQAEANASLSGLRAISIGNYLGFAGLDRPGRLDRGGCCGIGPEHRRDPGRLGN